MKLKKLAQRLALSLLTVLVSLVFLEVVLRAYHAMRDSMAPPALEILTYGPTIYEQNPEHPEINAQGLRDTEISIAKPDDAFRILVLGDSVAHGEHVPFDEAFPNQLERQLRDRVGTIVELFGAFIGRGHWYLMPLVTVLLTIGSLLVVAASSPLVAPFIYTLF